MLPHFELRTRTSDLAAGRQHGLIGPARIGMGCLGAPPCSQADQLGQARLTALTIPFGEAARHPQPMGPGISRLIRSRVFKEKRNSGDPLRRLKVKPRSLTSGTRPSNEDTANVGYWVRDGKAAVTKALLPKAAPSGHAGPMKAPSNQAQRCPGETWLT
jgi:hypothetical protein